MNWLTHLAVTFAVVTGAVLVASKLFADVKVATVRSAVGVALLFGVLNVVLGWLIAGVAALVLLPAALFTFGLAWLLVGFVVNCVLLWITDKAVKSFEINSFRALFGTAAIIGVAQWLLQLVK